MRLASLAATGIVGAHRAPGIQQQIDERARGRFAHVVRIRLERQAPQRNGASLSACSPKWRRIFSNSTCFWRLFTASTALRISGV